MPEEVGGFLEVRLLGQLVNIDTAVGQHARIAVDPADAGVCCHNSFESLCCYRSRHTILFFLQLCVRVNSLSAFHRSFRGSRVFKSTSERCKNARIRCRAGEWRAGDEGLKTVYSSAQQRLSFMDCNCRSAAPG